MTERSARPIDRLDLEVCARRIYELGRERDVRRGRSRARIPTWDDLPEDERSRLIAAYWRARAQYDAGRREPREVRISVVGAAAGAPAAA